MEPELDDGCAKYKFYYKHEVVNAVLCVALVIYIVSKPSFRSIYKFDLLPLLFIQFVQSGSYACFFLSIDFDECSDTIHWYDKMFNILMNIGFATRPFFILYALIRGPLHLRYSLRGQIASIFIPLAFAIIPITQSVEVVFDLDWISMTLPLYIMMFFGLINLGISVHFIKSGQTFPIIIALYEGLYLLPEGVKNIVAMHFNFAHYRIMEDNDDFAFLFTVIVCICVLAWRNRREQQCAKPEFISFDNHNFDV